MKPEQMHSQLMTHVERAVRPIRAEESTKCRMREDLYAHLFQIYQEELHQRNDEAEAVMNSCKRLGEPAALASELERTVSPFERRIAGLGRWISRRENESSLKHSFRIAFSTLVFVPLAGMSSLLVLLTGRLTGFSTHPIVGFSHLGFLILDLGLWLASNVFVFMHLGIQMRSLFGVRKWSSRSWTMAILLTTLSFATIIAGGFGLLIIESTDMSTALAFMPPWWKVASLAPFIFVPVCYLAAREVDRIHPWKSLNLDD